MGDGQIAHTDLGVVVALWHVVLYPYVVYVVVVYAMTTISIKIEPSRDARGHTQVRGLAVIKDDKGTTEVRTRQYPSWHKAVRGVRKTLEEGGGI